MSDFRWPGCPVSVPGWLKRPSPESWVRVCWAGCGRSRVSLNPSGGVTMTDLERGISKVLEEHRHESGLHIIGGQQRLIDRLGQVFEKGLNLKNRKKFPPLHHQNQG